MPEFIAEHVPLAPRTRTQVTVPGGWTRLERIQQFERFVAGYFETFEWLLPDAREVEEGIDRKKIRGWGADAKKRIRQECRDFWRANRKALAKYVEVTGRHYDGAGMDFYLTRDGHGAGFWDRGRHEALTRLTEASKAAGGAGDVFLSDRGWLRFTI